MSCCDDVAGDVGVPVGRKEFGLLDESLVHFTGLEVVSYQSCLASDSSAVYGHKMSHI